MTSPQPGKPFTPGTKAVLVDALGTLVWLEPPWERIDPAAVEGIEPEAVRAGFLAEIAYYTDHIQEGSDPGALADLRRRCAGVLSREVGREIDVETMMAAVRFSPFDDAVPALRGLRERGLRLICVSNWDCSLPEVLERVGLAPLLDGAVSSASSGARKPDPAIFEAGLELAGCSAAEALHVGDTDDDVAGARAAGIEVLRIDRSGGGDISSLAEIGEHLRA